MRIPARTLRGFAASLGLMLAFSGLAPAEDAAPVAPNSSTPADAQSISPTGLPALFPASAKKLNNLCPVCGKTRSECMALHEKAKKDPSLKSQECSIWQPDFATGKTRPWNCPISGWKVKMPMEGMRWTDIDTDLCPYPNGKIRYTSEITICPLSGFSAFQQDFRSPQPQEIKDWVAKNLTPGMEEALRARLGPQLKATKDQLLALFENQEEIPDTLRCTNAYQYYLKRMQDKDPAVLPSGLARVAWLAAWANRREISNPIQSGPLMEGVRKISSMIKKNTLDATDLEEAVRLLTEFYNDKERFDICERQILRIAQAGYYNRLGLNYWAQVVMQQAKAEAEKKYPDAASDPWLKIKEIQTMPDAARLDHIKGLRTSIINETNLRLNCLNQERIYLGYAAELIILALRNNEYEAQEIPSFTYMAGEFFRRQEFLSRSLLWLDATRQMLGDVARIQHLSPQQIDLLKRYVTDRKITPPAAPQAKDDWALLQKLAGKVRAAQAAKKAATTPATGTPAAVPPTTPKAPATSMPGAAGTPKGR